MQIPKSPAPGMRFGWLIAFALGSLLNPWLALAQSTFPNQPLRMMIPFPPGGGVDATGRQLADRLSVSLGQTVVVENRTGANGQLGVQAVASAPRDGYTLLYTSDSPLTVLPLLEPENVKYDVLRDLVPVTNVGIINVGLAVPKSLGVTDVKGFQDLMASEPTKHSFGSQGFGTVGHLAGSYLAKLISPQLGHVPYRGSGQAQPDLISGRLSFMVLSMREMDVGHKSGKLVGIATLARERVPGFNYPTVAEGGLPQMLKFDWYTSTMLLAPKGVPAPVMQRLNRDVTTILKDPDFVKRLADAGVTASPNTLPEAQALLERQVKAIPVLFEAIGFNKK